MIVDDELIRRARELTGIGDETELIRAGLRALISIEAGKRLTALGGTETQLADIPRRRSAEQ